MENMIDSFKFGWIKINGVEYTKDVIILPAGVKEKWWRESGHEVATIDIPEVLEAAPELLIIGTGESGKMRVLPEVMEALGKAGIELMVEPTPDACRLYNELSEKKKTAAALHLTC